MFEKVILHIGLDKTGSSAIQQACHSNRAILHNLGVLYPVDFWHGQFGSVWLDDPATYFYNTSQGRERKSKAEIQKEDAEYLAVLNAEISASTAGTLVLSYEGFSELGAAALERMHGYLKDIAPRTKVLLYCRDPLEYAASAISQLAKSGINTTGMPPIHAYRDICEKFKQIFGADSLVVRLFEKDSLPQGDVRIDFFDAIGLKAAEIKKLNLPESLNNSSLSAEAISIAQAIVDLQDSETTTSHEFGVRYAKILESLEGEKVHLTKDQFDFVISQSKAHVDFLKKHYSIDFRSNKKPIYKEVSASFGPTFQTSLARTLKALTDKHNVARAHDYEDIKLLEREVTNPEISIYSTGLGAHSGNGRGQILTFEIELFAARQFLDVIVGIHIFDSKNRWVYGSNSGMLGLGPFNIEEGSHRVNYYVVSDLPPGKYSTGFSINEGRGEGSAELVWQGKSCEFEVRASGGTKFVGYVDLPASVGIHKTPDARADARVSDATGSLSLVAPLPGLNGAETISGLVEISNESESAWRGDIFRPISLSYHWLSDTGDVLVYEGRRTPLPADGIRPGTRTIAQMAIDVPPVSGKCLLVLTIVQDRVNWFENMGFKPAQVSVTILATQKLS